MKLNRDYKQNPIKKGDLPDKEDLRYLMLDLVLTKEEIAEILGVKPSTVGKFCRKLGISRTKEQRTLVRQKTNLKKYGVINITCLPEVQEKMRQNSLKKYGVTHPAKCNEVKQKAIDTNMKRYGVPHAAQAQEIKDKVKQNCLEKYGVESKNKLPEKIQKCKDTCLKKYGYSCSLNNKDVRQKAINTNLRKLGVEYPMQSKEILEKSKQTFLKNYGAPNRSNAHLPQEVIHILSTRANLVEFLQDKKKYTAHELADILGITYEGMIKALNRHDCWDYITRGETQAHRDLKQLYPQLTPTRQIIAPYEIDLFDEHHNVGIEYNGTYWHCDKFKDMLYHQHKTNLATEKGVFLYHIFENEWNDNRKRPIIISHLNNLLHQNLQKVNLQKCQIREIDSNICKDFLYKNYLWNTEVTNYNIGIFKDELLFVMGFNQNIGQNYELMYICSKVNVSIENVEMAIFNYFVDKYNPQCITTYTDCAKIPTYPYIQMGFHLLEQTDPDYLWVNSNKAKIIQQQECQQYLKEQNIDVKQNIEQTMREQGFYKLFDCGHYKWKWYI